jgi:hypothetical protein
MAECINTRDLMFRSDIEAHALFEDLRENCEEDPRNGITMVPQSDWVEHVKELIADTSISLGELFMTTDYMGRKIDLSNEWPYRHVTIDYEAAAEELLSDYHEVEFEGTTYYVR